MGVTFHETSVAKSRKRRGCSWCGQAIEIGQPYRAYSWSDSGDYCRACMHPECYTAMQSVAVEEGGWFEWTPGDFHRGCGCDAGCCECKKQQDTEGVK